MFPEGAALLRILEQNTNGELGTLFDLRNIRPKDREIEQKYEITGKHSVDRRFAEILDKIAPAARKLRYSVEKCTVFAGVDQYYVVKGRGGSATFRYRFSANVPAELTVKTQLRQGTNLIRSEFNLAIPDAEVQHVRAFMSVVCTLAQSAKHFCIYQSGMFWTLHNADGLRCEVVVYKVGELNKAASHVFIEIEPKDFESPEEAIATIRGLETGLRLRGMRCNKSIAEIFGS